MKITEIRIKMKTPPKNIIPYKENKKVFLKRLLTKPRPKILLM